MKFCHALLGAKPEYYGRVAQACEAAGFHAVSLSDHMFYPENIQSKYPYTPDGTPLFDPNEDWPDVWVTVGSLAAQTTTLRFLTNVYVLPARNVFTPAKAIGTAAYLSNNRVAVGVGAGWMREEFELMEQPFERRGARMEEMVEVMRTLWTGEMVGFSGDFHDFPPVQMKPAPTEPVPVYIGGHSDRALRRAAEIGDGWIGMNYTLEELLHYCEKLKQAREAAGTADRDFEVICSPLLAPKPETLAQIEAAGVTMILTSAWFTSGITAPEIDRAEEMIHTYGERFITG